MTSKHVRAKPCALIQELRRAHALQTLIPPVLPRQQRGAHDRRGLPIIPLDLRDDARALALGGAYDARDALAGGDAEVRDVVGGDDGRALGIIREEKEVHRGMTFRDGRLSVRRKQGRIGGGVNSG